MPRTPKILQKIIFIAFLFTLILLMIFYPRETYQAAEQAITSWWTVVLPSLLPFFMASELLLRLGGAHLLGYFLEPVMRPLFHLPGSAGVALVLGYTAGFPTGAAITAGLYREGLCTKEEGERLLAFTNNASPLFIMITVCAAILNRPQLGFFLGLVHYSLNLLLGVFLGLVSRKKQAAHVPLQRKNLLAVLPPETLPLGTVCKEAVSKSLTNLAVIGGFMVAFSVLITMLRLSGAEKIFALAFTPLCQLLGIDTALVAGVISGFWEITLGVQTTASLGAPLAHTVAVIAAILAWSGVSIQMQIAAITAPAGLSLKTYFCSRILQSVLSALIVLHFFPAVPTGNMVGTAPLTLSAPQLILLYWQLLLFAFLLLAGIATAGAIIRLLQKIFYSH